MSRQGIAPRPEVSKTPMLFCYTSGTGEWLAFTVLPGGLRFQRAPSYWLLQRPGREVKVKVKVESGHRSRRDTFHFHPHLPLTELASLVGAAPTCSDLKDRTQCCLRSATRWKVASESGKGIPSSRLDFSLSLSSFTSEMGCLTSAALVRSPSQGEMLLLHHRHH